MPLAVLLEGALVLALLPLALWTVAPARGAAPVAGFLGCGLLLALAWLALGAPLVALVQAIGAALGGLLLRHAAARLGPSNLADPADRPAPALRLAIALLCLAVTAALGAAVFLLQPMPGPGGPAGDILLGTRLLDTLVALAILPVAALGLWSLAGGRPAAPPP